MGLVRVRISRSDGKTEVREMRPQLAADMFGEHKGRNVPDAIRRDENDHPTERIR